MTSPVPPHTDGRPSGAAVRACGAALLAALLTGCTGVGAPDPGAAAAPPPEPVIEIAAADTEGFCVPRGERCLPATDLLVAAGEPGVPVSVAFENRQPHVPHLLQVQRDDDDGEQVLLGSAVMAPQRQVLVVDEGLAPGGYRVSCVVHPGMTAHLEVVPGD